MFGRREFVPGSLRLTRLGCFKSDLKHPSRVRPHFLFFFCHKPNGEGETTAKGGRAAAAEGAAALAAVAAAMMGAASFNLGMEARGGAG